MLIHKGVVDVMWQAKRCKQDKVEMPGPPFLEEVSLSVAKVSPSLMNVVTLMGQTKKEQKKQQPKKSNVTT